MHTLAYRRLLVVLLVLALIALLMVTLSTIVLPALHHMWIHGLAASGSTPDIINHNH